MIKVCGVTFANGVNYGSEMQLYALRTAIDRITVEGEPCEYHLVFSVQDYVRYHNALKREFAKFIKNVLRRPFARFEKKWLVYAPAKKPQDLPALNHYYDAFVCGSDVIWNPDFNNKLEHYYLGFAEKYAFSYAASFGKQKLSDSEIEFARKRLSRLSAISVREKSGALLVQEKLGIPAVMMPDPVLLLNREEWEKTASPAKPKEKYALIYSTAPQLPGFKIMNELAAQTGCKVKTVKWVMGVAQKIKQGVFRFEAPEEWLELIRDAEYVFTNSFHATVFSVIFHKKVFAIVEGKKTDGYNVRIYDFMEDVGLGDRILSSMPETLDLSEPDFARADRVMEAWRDQGTTYLKNNLEAAYREKQALDQKLRKQPEKDCQ